MTYVKNTWVDQDGQVRYTMTEDGEGSGLYILTPNYEDVDPIGTPVNADNMNHIEDGIADCYDYVNTQITAMLETIYPVGSIYISTSATNPLEALFGTWVLVSANKALWTGDGSNAGSTKSAGLPDITGTARAYDVTEYTQYTGAFYGTGTGAPATGGGVTANRRYLGFQASRSNSIYGNSSTVQPPAYVVNVWRRTA